jgi:hypothetical protein
MSIPYDEIFFSTKREIAVCERSIRELKEIISSMEEKYHLNTAEFLGKSRGCAGLEEDDVRIWRESSEGLKEWEQRLRELRGIISC